MAFRFSTRRRQITKTSSSTSSSRSDNHGRSSLASHTSTRLRDRSTTASRSMPIPDLGDVANRLRRLLALRHEGFELCSRDVLPSGLAVLEALDVLVAVFATR